MKDILREIGTIARTFEAIANIEFKDIDLSKNQYLYIVRVKENPGIILEKLCDLIKVDRSTASRAVNKLVLEGYINKIDKNNTGKRKRLFLTEKGEETYDLLKREEDYSTKSALSGLDEEEIKHLLKSLQKVRKNVEPQWTRVKKGQKRIY
jgi:DNA-binding MarR family transcriptional regulator